MNLRNLRLLLVSASLSTLLSWSAFAQDFRRGDVDGNAAFEVTDPIALLGALFQGGAIGCESAADANDDSSFDISDAVYLLNFLFVGGAEPPAPYPGCGADPTPDGLSCVTYSCGGTPAAVFPPFGHLEVPTGLDPIGIDHADVDGDGELDLVVTGSLQNRVYVHLGRGDGSFELGSITDLTGSYPTELCVKDLDGDGLLDLIVVNRNSGDISILAGQPGGLFGGETRYPVGNSPWDLAVADFNGDGETDIATTCSDGVNVLDGFGLAFAISATLPSGSVPRGLAVGDLDGDGDMDLVSVGNYDNSRHIHLNDGMGGFSTTSETTPYGAPLALTLGNVDGDSSLDLVYSYGGSPTQVTFEYGDGNGGVSNLSSFAVSFSHASRALEVVDVDADGYADIVLCATNADRIEVLHGTPIGAFTQEGPFFTSDFPLGMTLADFDGDGLLDAAVTSAGRENVSVRLGALADDFSSHDTIDIAPALRQVVSADFDGNGFPDLATVSQTTSTLLISFNQGGGTFGTPVSYGVGASPRYLDRGDVDGDGDFDLVVSCINANSIQVLTNNGSGSFTVGSPIMVTGGVGPIFLRDFDANPGLDLIVGTNGNSVAVLSGAGGGAFNPLDDVSLSGQAYLGMNVDDFDEDGDLDFAVGVQGPNELQVYLGDGAGGFSQATSFPISLLEGVATGDVDGDGNVDVVTSSGTTRAVLLGDGTGAFQAPVYVPSDAPVSGITVADLDCDGTADIVAALGNFEPAVSVEFGLGGGSFLPTYLFSTGPRPEAPLAIDIDLDGDLDLVVTDYNAGSYSILRSRLIP